MSSRLNGFGAAFVAPSLLWQTAFFLFPLVFLVVLTFWRVDLFNLQPDFTFDNWKKIYSRAYFWRALLSTIGFATFTAILASILAFPVSCWAAFKLSPGLRGLVVMTLLAPFFTSYLVRIYSWQIYLGENGIINALLGFWHLGPVSMLNNAFGMMVGYLTLTLPLTALLQILGLAYVDQNLLKAAQNLGCGALRTIFIVAIPAAKPALTVAALFAFILVFGDFASPTYLGGANISTTTMLVIDLTKGGQQWPQAAVVATTTIIVLLVCTFAGLRYAYRNR